MLAGPAPSVPGVVAASPLDPAAVGRTAALSQPVSAGSQPSSKPLVAVTVSGVPTPTPPPGGAGSQARPSSANRAPVLPGSKPEIGGEIAALPTPTTTPAPSPQPTPTPASYGISGTVSDSSGPIPGASVEALAVPGPCPCFAATTDAAGAFTVRGVTAGSYHIYAAAGRGKHVSGYYTASGPATIDPSQAAAVRVSGVVSGIDIRLASGFQISGTITDGGGQARGGLSVTVCASGSASAGCDGPRVTSDSDGLFAIVVPSGAYALKVDDPNAIFTGGYYSGSGLTADRSAAATIQVSADRAGLDVTLPAARSGHSISGTATPVAPIGGEIHAYACPGAGGPCLARTSVGPGGAYSLLGLPDGPYDVRFVYDAEFDGVTATFDGYQAASGLSLARTGAATIVVAANVSGLATTLPVAQSIRGRLIGPDGQPLAGILVSAGDRLQGSYQATTGTDGRFAIAVDPGAYVLRFQDPNDVYPFGYYADGAYVRDWSAAAEVTSGTGGLDLGYVALPLARSVSGTLTGPDGKPLAGITVIASLADWYGDAETATTDGQGRFTIAGLGPATYFLMEEGDAAHARGFYARASSGGWSARFDDALIDTTPIAIGAADVKSIDMRVPAGYSLSGTLRDKAGQPVAGLAVQASDNGLWAETVTAADGTYQLSGVSGGSHTIWFLGNSTYAAGYYDATAAGAYGPDPTDATPISVASDMTGLDAVLPLGRAIAGTISGPDGQALVGSGIRVYACRHAGADHTGCAFADSSGSFSIRGLAPGSYTLTITSLDGNYASGYYGSASSGGFTTDPATAIPVLVGPADVSGLDIRVPRAFTISGTIRDSSGKPLAGAVVFACALPDLTDCYTTAGGLPTGPDGAYTVLHLPAGSYLLWLNAPTGYRNGYWSSSGWVAASSDGTAIDLPAVAATSGFDLALPPAIAPGAPTGVIAVAMDKGATVSWLPPADPGTSEIYLYVVTASDGHSGCSTTALGCAVSGLTDGLRYTFTVAAVSDAGTGPVSRASNAVTPAGRPSAPKSVVAIRGDGSVRVSWKAAVANGSPITGYTVTASPGGATCTAVVTTCMVSGLTDGTSYTFTVSAANALGTSPLSIPSAAVKPAAPASFGISTSAGNPVAGTPVDLTVTVLDAAGDVLPGYAGKVHLASSDAGAALPADYTFTSKDEGKHVFSVTLKTAGQESLTAIDTAAASVKGREAIDVQAGAAVTISIQIPPGATWTSGTSGEIHVTAFDAFGNTATGYTGTIHFTSTDAAAVVPADYTFTPADAGGHVFEVTFMTAGDQSLAVVEIPPPPATPAATPVPAPAVPLKDSESFTVGAAG